MSSGDLADEAIFLGRLVTELLPPQPEALGLLASMLHAEARRRPWRDPHGEFVRIAEQNPALWDSQVIDEAEATLLAASAFGPSAPSSPFAPVWLIVSGGAAATRAGGALRLAVAPIRWRCGRNQIQAAFTKPATF